MQKGTVEDRLYFIKNLIKLTSEDGTAPHFIAADYIRSIL